MYIVCEPSINSELIEVIIDDEVYYIVADIH